MAKTPTDWIFVAKEVSLDDSLEVLRRDVLAKLNHKPKDWLSIPTYVSAPSSTDYWVHRIYYNYVIVCRSDGSGLFWRADYHYNENGELVVGELIPVEMAWVPKNGGQV